MNKKVKIEKELFFTSMIGEISAISLEKKLEITDHNIIEGNLIVSGKYKATQASQIEEDFHYEIPIEITITERVDPSSTNIEITDFYYEIEGNNSLKCNIELSVEGVEILEERECDGDPITMKEVELPHIEQTEEIIEKDKEKESEVEKIETNRLNEPEQEEKTDNYLFNVNEENESFGTFIVYIVRQNETINQIIEKYHTSLEEIEKYNNIKEMTVGSKIIIPYINENNS